MHLFLGWLLALAAALLRNLVAGSSVSLVSSLWSESGAWDRTCASRGRRGAFAAATASPLWQAVCSHISACPTQWLVYAGDVLLSLLLPDEHLLGSLFALGEGIAVGHMLVTIEHQVILGFLPATASSRPRGARAGLTGHQSCRGREKASAGKRARVLEDCSSEHDCRLVLDCDWGVDVGRKRVYVVVR